MTDERLLAEIDELRIYATHIEVAGRRKTFDEVQQVGGGSTEVSVNLLPAVKHTSISISFAGGDSYYMDEDRTIFGRDRHRRIAECVRVLRQLTFEARLQMLVAALAQKETWLIGRESIETYTLIGALGDAVRRRQPSSVYLHKAGTITNGVLTLDLKRCRSEGVLEFGVTRQNKNVPGQVYACNERSWFEKSNNSALKFDVVGEHDQDVVLAVLDWLATPGNQLGVRTDRHG